MLAFPFWVVNNVYCIFIIHIHYSFWNAFCDMFVNLVFFTIWGLQLKCVFNECCNDYLCSANSFPVMWTEYMISQGMKEGGKSLTKWNCSFPDWDSGDEQLQPKLLSHILSGNVRNWTIGSSCRTSDFLSMSSCDPYLF